MSNTIQLTLGGSLELVLRPPPIEPQCFVTARCGGFEARARGFQMAYTLPADKMVVVRVDYVDAHGHPAKIDGEVRWDSSAAEIVSLDPDQEDSQICSLYASGQLGTAQVTAHADADLGEGVRELVTVLDVTVVAGQAVAGTISPTGEPQPVAPHPEQQAAG